MNALPLMVLSPADLGPRAAAHLLNRIGFGPSPGDVKAVLDKGLDRYIDEQLRPTADPDVESRLRALTTLGYSVTQTLTLYNQDSRAAYNVVVDEFYSAKFIRAVHSANQLQEVMVDFWFNHFNVNIGENFVRTSIMAYERDAIRPHVLGKFRDLLAATANHPAMMYYLDNWLSTLSRVVGGVLRQGLNENYGRELMELHTVGVDAGYKQEDVFEASRALTGWGIDNANTTGNFLYRSANHDTGAKSVFGLNLPAGGQKDDGDKLIDYLASRPSTAHFVSKKLVRRLVADDPPQSLVDRAAQTFLSTGGDIVEVLKTIIGSTEFWAGAFDDGGPTKPKTPIEFVVSALRATDAQVQNARGLTPYMANMGMPLYQCIPPTGYSNSGADWLNPSSQLYRMNFALDLAAGGIAGVTADPLGMIRAAGGNITNASSMATTINREIFANGLSPDTVAAASKASSAGVSMAAKVVGLCLAGPEMQAR